VSVAKREAKSPWPGLLDWPDERFDRAFRDMFREFFSAGAMRDRLAESVAHQLHLEQFVEDGACVIRAELPGLDPEKDVEITVQSGVLTIEAHREARSEEKRPEGFRSEFHYGAFRRSVRLPDGVTDADVAAAYKDGILEVRLPLKESPKAAVRVPVARG
jgi:HSP20 family protein